MRHGMSPKDAALDCLKRVARNFDNDEKRLAQVELSFYVLRKDGEYCAASLWKSESAGFAVCTDGNARAEQAVYLLERKG
jgi:N4-(beta-N-acetylglucosaminyl)-L-asparaginase